MISEIGENIIERYDDKINSCSASGRRRGSNRVGRGRWSGHLRHQPTGRHFLQKRFLKLQKTFFLLNLKNVFLPSASGDPP